MPLIYWKRIESKHIRNRMGCSSLNELQRLAYLDAMEVETYYPRLQLIGFYQKNTTDNLNSVNMRLAWEYQPLSYVYLVFNTLNYQGTDSTQQKQQSFLAKLSYLKQF